MRIWLDRGTTILVLVGVWTFLLYYFKPSLLLMDTMDAGGDTPSFMRPMHHLKDVLLPAGNPQGWDLGNFAGYAPYQFYFLPPALSIVLLSYVIPFNVAFKLVSVSGVFLLPLAMLLALRAMRFAFPVPAIGAAASLLFLFNEGNSMWGGNIPSTLAGEFAHSIGFGLSVLFVGYLYKGVEEQKGWRGLGALLALTGLYHPVAFLNAATGGVFFVLNRRDFAKNLRFLMLDYLTAVLLMGFWLVPLVAKIGYATSINWTWHFPSLWDLMPEILWPPAILALCDVVWIAIFRRPENRPARYIVVTMIITAVFFFNATEVGLPEIRFVPFSYVLMIFLALDFIRRVLPLHIGPHVAAIALSLSIVAWVQKRTTFIPSWIKWNYEGIERKPSYPLLKAITTAVQGKISDPRVAYENSPKHDRFGSMRIFENMALLSGRPTLEGVLLQTGVNSPFIYWLQSQISKQGTGVIPGYSYPNLDLNRATPRLAMFNAHDIIVITDEVTKALEGDPRWERTFQQQGYSIFHLKDADPHYVRVPKFQPVRLATSKAKWKKDFHRWFSTDASLDVPIVADYTIPPDELKRFPLQAASPTDLPHEPLDASCQIDEKIDHLRMEFTTTCPGKPHLVSVAYFPNWQVEGASHVYLVSPAFMLVFPEGNHVVMTYRRIGADWLGIALSFVGLAMVAVGRRRQPLPAPQGALVNGLNAVHPVLLVGGVLFVVGTTGWHVLRDFGPQYYYKRAWDVFTKNDYDASLKDFDWALWLGGDTSTAGDAAFFRAASLFRKNEWAQALAAYQLVVDRFPDSIWPAEAQYHIGLCLRRLTRRDEATAKFKDVIATYPGNRWAGFAQEQLDQMAKEAAPPPPS
jgi:hypothetical protein